MKTLFAPIVTDNKVPTTDDMNKAFNMGSAGKEAGLRSIIMNSDFMDLLALYGGNIEPLVKAYNNGYRS